MLAKILQKVKKEPPKTYTHVKWTPDYIKQVVETMLSALQSDESIIFKSKLCHKLGFSLHNFNVNAKPKVKDEKWFEEIWTFVEEILHTRLQEMILHAKNPGGGIWLDKTVFKTKEPVNDSEDKIKITVEYEEI